MKNFTFKNFCKNSRRSCGDDGRAAVPELQYDVQIFLITAEAQREVLHRGRHRQSEENADTSRHGESPSWE